ncbi:tyrosine-type recombinase/integrase [Phocicoccus pinnipedialis]|uniref:Tyrosine recombinase XerC n=1 Tax=Phocicoccus pinnipedialis TaxID=110845 RepID=A0A6V7R5H2_9BACL|nr:site-specific integrase [Jeotgalicoccus pinnipedialis]MBP1939846.1 integrase [Jeotgalicoccus pinnipedialis]CAD2072566.1 Tyrosine recombinase XerC [Jeotgalicoccus pinnipedialis]
MTKINRITLKNGEFRYEFNVYLGIDPLTGKKKRTTRRFKSKRSAEVALRKLELSRFENNVSSINKYTFKDIYNLWLENHKNEIRGTTLASKQSKFNKRILPKFGRLLINEITVAYCQSIVNEWSKEMQAYNDYIIQTRLVFNYAERLEIINKNPMRLVSLPKKKNEKEFVVEKKQFLDSLELKLFMEILESEQNTLNTCLFRVLAFTGMRKGEVLALHWSDVNLQTNELYVQKTLVKVSNKHLLQPPKTKASYRWLDIDQKTINFLKRWKIEQKELYKEFGFHVQNDENQPIFTTYHHRLNKMNYMRVSTPNDKLEAFFGRHKELHKIKIHGFRHTHASLLFEAGATIKEVQSRLGHSDIKTTMDIYTHITTSSRKRLAEKFQNHIDF